MSRYLFTAHPLDGHINPLRPLIDAATQAGHETYLFWGPECDWTQEPIASVFARSIHQKDNSSFLSDLFSDTIAPLAIPPLLDILTGWKPDLVVSDPTDFGSWIAAERAHVLRVMNVWGLPMSIAELNRCAGLSLATLRHDFGLPPDGRLETIANTTKISFAPSMYLSSPVENVFVFKPTLPEEVSVPDWFMELPDRPTIFVTLGTIYNQGVTLSDTILAGVASEDVNVITTLHRGNEAGRSNVHVMRDVPYSLFHTLLGHCDAVISHAGYGTVMSSLSHGVPSVLIPCGADNFEHAKRCSELGVAEVLDREGLVPWFVNTALLRVLEEKRFRNRAGEIAAEIAKQPGPEVAVAFLEDEVAEWQP